MARALRWIAILGAVALPLAADAGDSQHGLRCNIGPVQRTFGKNDWFVLSCSDRRTLIVYAMPDNPASPNYFMWRPNVPGGIQVHSSGIGDKAATQVALRALRRMSSKDAAVLIEETRRAAHLAGP